MKNKITIDNNTLTVIGVNLVGTPVALDSNDKEVELTGYSLRRYSDSGTMVLIDSNKQPVLEY